jgi:hypothetical protein
MLATWVSTTLPTALWRRSANRYLIYRRGVFEDAAYVFRRTRWPLRSQPG